MKIKQYAPLLVRIAVALVFTFFGLHQLIQPLDFVGYVPAFVAALVDVNTIVFFNGLFDLLLGILLFAGLFTRWVALVGALHIFGIAGTLWYSDIAVRDLGLALAALSVALHGADKWCLDRRLW